MPPAPSSYDHASRPIFCIDQLVISDRIIEYKLSNTGNIYRFPDGPMISLVCALAINDRAWKGPIFGGRNQIDFILSLNNVSTICIKL